MPGDWLMLLDTHCHLDAAEFALDRDAVIDRALAAGVKGIVIPAVDPSNFEAVRTLAHQIPGGTYALGIHPMYVQHLNDHALVQLHDALSARRADPRLIAVGEIGLDFFVPEISEGKGVPSRSVFTWHSSSSQSSLICQSFCMSAVRKTSC